MNRRAFLKLSSVVAAPLVFQPLQALAQQPTTSAAVAPSQAFDRYFLQILDGFLRNAVNTGPGFAAVDFPDGTIVKTCQTPSNHGYVGVARMLPAMAQWVVSKKQPTTFNVEGQSLTLEDVLLQIYRNAFDPKHPNYWGEPPKEKPTQRSVEAALVAVAITSLGPDFVAKLTSEQRTNVQNWLASCTIVPERTNNHAWFTSLNQAARLELSHAFKEFQGDEAWMLADLKALDALAPVGDDGWYSDHPDQPVFDYYNFWTFGNFPLFWSRAIGKRYPEWDAKFRGRVKQFLQKTPYFFAANGAIPLYGRSLSYRWDVLSPLVLGYEMGLWPHAPGLLRKIVRTNLEWFWNMGAYDEQRGKLRETLTPDGTPDVTEAYIDQGHPYWCMQAFTLFGIPPSDPFWTDKEELLPVEKDDYAIRFEGPKMLVTGTKASGQVKWALAHNFMRREYYRDKYTKFVASSHFPFNVFQLKGRVPWDQALVIREKSTGLTVGRSAITGGELTSDGIKSIWSITISEKKFDIVTTVRLLGDFEHRTHEITAPDGISPDAYELVEGSYPLGLTVEGNYNDPAIAGGRMLRAVNSAHAIAAWGISGYVEPQVVEWFDESKQMRVNIVHPRMAVLTLVAPIAGKTTKVSCLTYASPKPLSVEEIAKRAQDLMVR
jgi:hypothetical protein